MKQIPVIMDCDTGADDALALLLMLSVPQIKLLGITSVCGNTEAEQTAINNARVLRLAGKTDTFVYTGAAQPLCRELKFSSKYCGNDGLCDTGLADAPELLAKETASEFLIRTLKSAEEPVTVLSTAGFTNLAQALKRDPAIRAGIREIVAASGYFGLNQKEVRAEWNIVVDPEAADIVYHSGIPIRAVGLDVTCMLTNTYTEELLHVMPDEEAQSISRFLKGCDAYNQKAGLKRSSLLVDGMAAACVIDPACAQYVSGTVEFDVKRTDAGMIRFVPGAGTIQAAESFDISVYMEMLKGILRK